jgi:hypothetical protein
MTTAAHWFTDYDGASFPVEKAWVRSAFNPGSKAEQTALFDQRRLSDEDYIRDNHHHRRRYCQFIRWLPLGGAG